MLWLAEHPLARRGEGRQPLQGGGVLQGQVAALPLLLRDLPAAAEARLRRGDVDVVVQFPEDPLGTVLRGEQAQITVLHTRLDPIEREGDPRPAQAGGRHPLDREQGVGLELDRAAEEQEIEGELVAGRGVGAASAVADVTDPAAVERAVAELERELGPVDALVNNAGSLRAIGPLWEVDAADWWAD